MDISPTGSATKIDTASIKPTALPKIQPVAPTTNTQTTVKEVVNSSISPPKSSRLLDRYGNCCSEVPCLSIVKEYCESRQVIIYCHQGGGVIESALQLANTFEFFIIRWHRFLEAFFHMHQALKSQKF